MLGPFLPMMTNRVSAMPDGQESTLMKPSTAMTDANRPQRSRPIALALACAALAAGALALTACDGSSNASTAQASVGPLQLEPTTLDMGDLVPDQTVTKRVKLTNLSSKPITVTNAVADCSCTTPTWPTDPIAPGATVETDISIKPGPKQGVTLTKRVTFTLEDGDPVNLTVVGKVGLFIEQSTDMLRAPADTVATPAPDTVSFRGADGTPFKITSIDQPFVAADNGASGMNHVVLVDWAKWREADKPTKFSVFTDHPKSGELVVSIRRTASAPAPAQPAASSGEHSSDEIHEGTTLVRGPVETISGKPPRQYAIQLPTVFPGAQVIFPPLGEFVQGTKLGAFAKGRVIVLEFFSTTCSHCEEAAPVVKALVDDFSPKDFDFVSLTSEDPAKVREWLAKPEHAELVRHAVAIDAGGLALKALLAPTYYTGTPRMMAIRDGVVLWYGHPDDARAPFDKIAAGTWDSNAVRQDFIDDALLARAKTQMNSMRTRCDKDGKWMDLLQLLESMAVAMPSRAGFFEAQKYSIMIGPAQMTEAGYAFGRRLAQKYATDHNTLRMMAYSTLSWPSVQVRDLDFAMQLATDADARSKQGDARVSEMLALAYFSKGNREKALEVQERAIALMTDPRAKQKAQQTLARFKTDEPKPIASTPPKTSGTAAPTATTAAPAEAPR